MRRIPGIRKYPKEYLIPTVENDFDFDMWEVKFVNTIKNRGKIDRDLLGLCDPEINIISVCKKQKKEDILKTVIHELIHAVEFSMDKDIPHEMVYAIEQILGDLFIELFKD